MGYLMPDMEHIATVTQGSTSTPSVYVTMSFTSIPTTYSHLVFKGMLTNPSTVSDGFVLVSLNGDTPGVSNTYNSSSFGVQGGNPDQYLNGNDSYFAMRYLNADNTSGTGNDGAPTIIEGWIPFSTGRTSKYYGNAQIMTRASQKNNSAGTNQGSTMHGRIEKPTSQADITQIDFQAWPGLTTGDFISLYGLKG
jgi:hypothetical protein